MQAEIVRAEELQHIVGLADPPYEMEVERGKVREFARAVYSNHPAYVTDARPIIPPTFLTVGEYGWGHLLEQPEITVLSKIPFDLFETFDAEEEFVFHGPLPRVGDRLTVYKTIERIYEKESARSGKLTFVQFLSRFQNGTRLVAEMRSSWVKTEKPSEQEIGTTSVETPSSRLVRRGSSPFGHIKQSKWEQIRKGHGPGAITMEPLTLLEIVRYEGAITGFGPVHFDQGTARAWGYPRVYSTGLMHSGALASYLTYWLGPENVKRFKTRFVNIIWLGDRLIYEGTITRKYSDGTDNLADVELRCSRDTGEPLVTGEATVIFHNSDE
jgi:acyl dehydratase